MKTDKLCTNCRHFQKIGPHHTFGSGRCLQPGVDRKLRRGSIAGFHTIDIARDICDREGDGRFVYYDPLEDTSPASHPSHQEEVEAAHA